MYTYIYLRTHTVYVYICVYILYAYMYCICMRVNQYLPSGNQTYIVIGMENQFLIGGFKEKIACKLRCCMAMLEV